MPSPFSFFRTVQSIRSDDEDHHQQHNNDTQKRRHCCCCEERKVLVHARSHARKLRGIQLSCSTIKTPPSTCGQCAEKDETSTAVHVANGQIGGEEWRSFTRNEVLYFCVSHILSTFSGATKTCPRKAVWREVVVPTRWISYRIFWGQYLHCQMVI